MNRLIFVFACGATSLSLIVEMVRTTPSRRSYATKAELRHCRSARLRAVHFGFGSAVAVERSQLPVTLHLA